MGGEQNDEGFKEFQISSRNWSCKSCCYFLPKRREGTVPGAVACFLKHAEEAYKHELRSFFHFFPSSSPVYSETLDLHIT